MTRRTGLQFPNSLAYSIWERIGKQISLITDSSAWWLGDWLIYGEKEYADRYRMAIEQTSLDYQTLRNYAWVARRFSLGRRRDKLSFAHHAEVAALSPADQDLWLLRAERHAWSRNRLRRELRGATGPDKTLRADASQRDHTVDVNVRLTSSPEQLERWKLAARMQNRDLVNWMVDGLESIAQDVIGEYRPENDTVKN
ncbi:LmbU family transcriptional regulator [Nonomuraea antri]|uniref:LmbU family transcriptional regulator n=1 Tax=Nonomuraea antri TaxID=2730852 RepID=UPI002E2E45B8|nr:LmbU family transcriptional regulator [Nonomuraea antri]